MRSRGTRAALVLAIAALGASATSPGARAAIPATLHNAPGCSTKDAADNDTGNGLQAPYVFCDDGVPSNGDPIPGPGGLIPNTTGASAITVPAKYGSDHFTGLPASAGAPTDPGADANGNIALDVDVSLPTSAPPAGGYPMVVLMHGCCGGNKTGWEASTFDAGGEKWHDSNAWFASRGYVVITYTARGFVNSNNRGSTGQTQLDSRDFEINDYQSLACQVLAHAPDFNDVTGRAVSINPQRVVATGGSYGGGFSWLAFTDPKWQCNSDTGAAGTNMKLAVAAPKYGWTDLVYTLVPNGMHSELPESLPATNGCDTGPRQPNGSACPGGGAPVGMPKTSIVAGLYATGNLVTGGHATFPPSIHEAFQCLNGPYPPENNPACANTISTILPEFLSDRSAYYQNDFFARIAGDSSYRIPLFDAATFTDPLFPAYENRRMINRLLSVVHRYPVQAYYGDYQHFTQNKAKGWGDLCGGDHHVCTLDDYPGGNVNADPATLVRTGITTRLNKFIDNYARPAGGFAPAKPAFDVTADLEICPQNAGAQPGDEPGPTFKAPTFEALTPGTLSLDLPGTQQTISEVEPNPHAVSADPVVNQLNNGSRCPVERQEAGPGVASYTTDPLTQDATMLGSASVTIDFSIQGSAEGFQLNSRLYDVFPDGTAVMVDRGPRRLTAAEIAGGEVTYQLHGNGWRFPAGHSVRIEVAQDDEPFVKNSDVPSSATLSGVHLALPTRERRRGRGPNQ